MDTRTFLMQMAIAEKIRKRAKKRGKAIRIDVSDTVNSYPVFHALHDIKQNGGLNYTALRKIYGDDQIKDLLRKRPCIVSFNGKARLDEVAQEHGFQDDDTLMEAIMSTPSKKAIIKDIRKRAEVDILKNHELTKRNFEKTDGAFPDTLGIGDELYMGGSFYTVIGFREDFIVLQSQHEQIKIDAFQKLPCEAIKRKE